MFEKIVRSVDFFSEAFEKLVRLVIKRSFFISLNDPLFGFFSNQQKISFVLIIVSGSFTDYGPMGDVFFLN